MAENRASDTVDPRIKHPVGRKRKVRVLLVPAEESKATTKEISETSDVSDLIGEARRRIRARENGESAGDDLGPLGDDRLAARVAERLGGPRAIGQTVAGELDLHRAIERGLPATLIDTLFAAGFARDEVHHLVGPERTLQRRKREQARLNVEEGDRLVSLHRLLLKAEDVLGSIAIDWLRSPLPALGDQAPLSMVGTAPGRSRVEAVLRAAEHGFAA